MGVVCACLVVFIHVMVEPSAGTAEWWVYHLFKRGVCNIAVPFFFAAAGYFLAGHCRETGWWARETRKRMRTLLAPYCAWVLLALLWGTALALTANLLAGDGVAFGAFLFLVGDVRALLGRGVGLAARVVVVRDRGGRRPVWVGGAVGGDGGGDGGQDAVRRDRAGVVGHVGGFPRRGVAAMADGALLPNLPAAHQLRVGPARGVLNRLPGTQAWAGRLPWYVGCGVTAIVVSGGVALALRRWAPRLAGVLFGGR